MDVTSESIEGEGPLPLCPDTVSDVCLAEESQLDALWHGEI